jgi:hypothetical protein
VASWSRPTLHAFPFPSPDPLPEDAPCESNGRTSPSVVPEPDVCCGSMCGPTMNGRPCSLRHTQKDEQ